MFLDKNFQNLLSSETITSLKRLSLTFLSPKKLILAILVFFPFFKKYTRFTLLLLKFLIFASISIKLNPIDAYIFLIESIS